ncbi:recombination protein NinB [bacterium]|nr:recombination protein NinB [bacterium]MBR2387091.1 recombination protein NinB [bacterium]
MEFILKEQRDILAVQNELMNILPEIKDKPYICELKQFRKRRSLDANSYFHVLVDKIAKQTKKSAEEVKVELNLDYGTIAQDERGLKVGFKALEGIPIEQFVKYAKPIGYEIEGGKKFIKYIVYKETHTLDSAEMAFLIDGVIQEAKQLGIETLTPAELETLKGYRGE